MDEDDLIAKVAPNRITGPILSGRQGGQKETQMDREGNRHADPNLRRAV